MCVFVSRGGADFVLDMLNIFSGGAAQNCGAISIGCTDIAEYLQMRALDRVQKRLKQLNLVLQTRPPNPSTFRVWRASVCACVCMWVCTFPVGLTKSKSCATALPERVKSAKKQIAVLEKISKLDAKALAQREKRQQHPGCCPIYGDLARVRVVSLRPSESWRRHESTRSSS